MWELDHRESWAPKYWRFWTVVLEKTLESSLDCKEIKSVNPKGNQSWIKYSLERLMLKLQSFGHLMQGTDSLEKTLMMGKIEGRRRRGRPTMSWLDGITDSMDVSLSVPGSWWWTGRPGVLRFMGSQRVGHNWTTDLIWSDPWWYRGWEFACQCPTQVQSLVESSGWNQKTDDGNCWNPMLPYHQPEKKVMHPAAIAPNVAFKNPSLKTFREFKSFQHERLVLLAGHFQ